MNPHWLKASLLALAGVSVMTLSGCATIKLGPSYHEPIKEQVVSEAKEADGKVLLMNITGMISDAPSQGFLKSGPSMLNKVMMQLEKAEKDKSIKTVLIKMNTPGGGATTSDIIYHELMQFKKRTGKKVYVQMMDVAASGGYYISMAADHVQAHPTTITGSVGVINILPNVTELTEKIGVKVTAITSGKNKDLGSPFKEMTAADRQFMQKMIDQMADQFHGLVQTHRDLSDAQMKDVKTARIYTGKDAKQAGLVDSLGYLSDAKQAACELGGAKRCHLVTYRFDRNVNANLYSPSMNETGKTPEMTMVKSEMLNPLLELKPGAYYLYLK